MCQQGQAEIEYCMWSEKEEIHQKYEKHVSGEHSLTDYELKN